MNVIIGGLYRYRDDSVWRVFSMDSDGWCGIECLSYARYPYRLKDKQSYWCFVGGDDWSPVSHFEELVEEVLGGDNGELSTPAG